MSTTHYVPVRFRLPDEKVGLIQTRYHDQGWKVRRLARTHRLSVSTIYRIVKAVPAHLVTIRKPRSRRAA